MEIIGNVEHGGIAKCWTDGVELEQMARDQITNIAGMPFIFRHVAVMPDAHAGIGATVGTDETPGAYKDIDSVMAAQKDLVEIVHTLKAVVCVKG